jgi:outer membrane protein TolC
LLVRGILCVLLLAPAVAWPQETLTLDQAVALALKSNRLVRAAELEVEKADDAVEMARTYRLPQFSFRLYELQFLAKSNFLFPGAIFGSFPQIGPVPPTATPVEIARRPASIPYVQATQPLTQLRRVKLGVELQRLSRQIAAEKLREQQEDIANQVKATYYNLLQAQSGLVATEESLKLFQELDRVSNEALLQQVVLRGDVLEAQAGRAKTELDLVVLRNTSSTLKEKLNELMGRDLSADFMVRGALEPEAYPMDLAAVRARALEQRPELREAHLKKQQAEADYQSKKTEYIPDVSLIFTYLSPFNVSVVPKNITVAGFALSWDVFDFGRKRHDLLAKSHTIEQAGAAIDETSAQILLDVGNRYRKLEEARQQLRVATLSRDVSQERVRVGLNRYEQQAVMLTDLLQLQTSLAETSYKYSESLLGYWTARAELEKAMGE